MNHNLHASTVFSGLRRSHAVMRIEAGDGKAQILLLQILFLPLLLYLCLHRQCYDPAWQCAVKERTEDM